MKRDIIGLVLAALLGFGTGGVAGYMLAPPVIVYEYGPTLFDRCLFVYLLNKAYPVGIEPVRPGCEEVLADILETEARLGPITESK